jgi:hypothetical protein
VAYQEKRMIGYTLYERGGMTTERLIQFLNQHITDTQSRFTRYEKTKP